MEGKGDVREGRNRRAHSSAICLLSNEARERRERRDLAEEDYSGSNECLHHVSGSISDLDSGEEVGEVETEEFELSQGSNKRARSVWICRGEHGDGQRTRVRVSPS